MKTAVGEEEARKEMTTLLPTLKCWEKVLFTVLKIAY